MAIAFARPEYVSRSNNKNACLKGAYNARTIVKDIQTGVIYNFQSRKDNVYHEIFLPEHVDQKFKNVSLFTNEIERSENRKDSQLCVEWLIALPKEEEITLDMKKEIIKEFIERKGWIREGLGVQLDIHKPHEGDVNWHAHLLVTTRRFRKDGLGFESKKARDLQPKVLNGCVQKSIEIDNHNFYRKVLEDKIKEWGVDLRVDLPGEITQEHIGPVRMRSVLNQAAERNEERRLAEIEHLDCGARVLEKVTRHMSVFTKGDLMRAVKYVLDLERKEKLVEDALADNSVIALYREDGSCTEYYTTSAVRVEEQKILRLSSYVASVQNVFTSNQDVSKRTIESIVAVEGKLTEEQHNALTELLTSKSALQIVRGRAGVGKSHVLGQIAAIALECNIYAIGVAPTHKAKEALASDGFRHTDTIKGMLFKLANGRFYLPKNSVLVVDEAGMIGNDDFSELLRVAATRKCTVILSGDERQLTSVQRGGMFEVLANKYRSSTILDIKRQDSNWGKRTAMALSNGDVRSAVSILEEEQRIKWSSDAIQSMQSLVADWHKSSYAIDDKIILAVRNKDVAALNHGVRQYLKLEGKLKGQEIEVGGDHYMRGDRIVISSTNKELGIVNGELGVILDVSTNRFIISLTNPNYIKDSKDSKSSSEYRMVEFNPSEFNSFKHGYAVTIFKGQGASIKDVYVYHNGFAGLRNSYVALSRNISELNLYVNKIATLGRESLIRQMSKTLDSGSSLNYLTKEEANHSLEDIDILNNMNGLSRSLVKIYDFAANNITKLMDKYLPQEEYYNYREPSKSIVRVEEVFDRVYEENQHMDAAVETREEKLVVGGNLHSSQIATGKKLGEIGHVANTSIVVDDVTSSVSNSSVNDRGMLEGDKDGNIIAMSRKGSSKDRFYENIDYKRGQENKWEENRERYRSEVDNLRRELSMQAESVVVDLLGNPNRKLSKGSTLKYGNNGSLAVKISGNKAGTWYDFSEGKGGDLFDLVQREKNYDFKESVSYLQDRLGMTPNKMRSNLQVVNDHVISDRYVEHCKRVDKENSEEIVKIRKAEELYTKSKELELSSTAGQYLVQTRKIDIDLVKEDALSHDRLNDDGISRNSLSQDIRTTNVYEKSVKRKVPALVAFARNTKGDITGGQQILLDSKTNNKADVDIVKRSFGKIAGSFVDVGSFSNGDINSEFNSHSNSTNTNSNTDIRNRRSITIIAEGLETALSVKQALGNDSAHQDKQIKIVCSLGISNIKNYHAVSGEKIIIAADNDGIDAVTNVTIDTAKHELIEKGAFVEIVRPSNPGDFNDILKDKGLGEEEIQHSFSRALTKHAAVTLEQYFGSSNEGEKLSKQEHANISYIQQFKINEEKIIDAYRSSNVKGSSELDSTRKSIEFADNFVDEHKDLVNEANRYGAKLERQELAVSLVGKSYEEMKQSLTSVRDKYYTFAQLGELVKAKQRANTPEQAFKALENEQKYLASLHVNCKEYEHDYKEYDYNGVSLLKSIKHAYRNEKNNVFEQLNKLGSSIDRTAMQPRKITNTIKHSTHSASALQSLTQQYHVHVIDRLKQHLNDIHSGKEMIIDGRSFTCQLKLLDYALKVHENNEFFPREHIQQGRDKFAAQQRVISKEFEGPSL
ncbi:AAA family ATPase [Candidatus Tisiphia endosymbiont of Nemotelus uliginosus]|uniref:AAA family ATPase n=1 Tax=Candidatus Tisiphia endosymbiont of Nemotelus uliginosus TaxID=3077926 RepID=UPI0035C8C58E